MELLIGCSVIALFGVVINLSAAWALKRPDELDLECSDGTTVTVAPIPSLADHNARMINRDDGWMQTFSGKRFDPLDPRAEDIDLADIAHGLAMTCRYGGQCLQFYSVAEHCILVSEFVEVHACNAGLSEPEVRNLARLGLMHDSGEAYIGDMIRPLKHQPEMVEFRRAEAAIERAIAKAFGLKWTAKAHATVKRIDDRILVDEISHLMANPEMYIRPWLDGLSPLGALFRCMAPAEAEREFLARYLALFGAPNAR